MDKINTKQMIGKIVVSEETGKKIGIVGDFIFIAESGEITNIILSEPTNSAHDLGLTENENGKLQIPFSAVKSVGDFIIISEKDIS